MSDPHRPVEALRILRDGFSDCMTVVYDRVVFVPSLHHLRSWTLLTAWGLGELATLDESDAQPSTVLLLAELQRGSLADVAWEVERLEVVADEVLARLMASGDLKTWHEQRRCIAGVLAGLWKLLRRQARPQLPGKTAVALTALGRAVDALEDRRRRAFLMLDQIHPGQRHVEVDREVVRHWIALADLGAWRGAKAVAVGDVGRSAPAGAASATSRPRDRSDQRDRPSAVGG